MRLLCYAWKHGRSESVEIWFSKIQRDLIARGIFESKTDLHRQIMRYIRHYNKAALPFKWTYKNTDRRIR